MFLPTLISSFALLAAIEPAADRGLPPTEIQSPLDQALQIVRSHHLETADGRIAFLGGDLTAFVQEADALNREIQALALEASSKGQEEVLAMGEDLNQKMAQMIEMLPSLQTALLIEQDFEEIDGILAKNSPLEEVEKELLLRIASLCTYLDARKAPL